MAVNRSSLVAESGSCCRAERQCHSHRPDTARMMTGSRSGGLISSGQLSGAGGELGGLVVLGAVLGMLGTSGASQGAAVINEAASGRRAGTSPASTPAAPWLAMPDG